MALNYTVIEKGAQSVKVEPTDSEKLSVTYVLAILGDRTKLP